MKKFAEMIIKYRLIILVIEIGITIFFGYQLKDAKVNSDILTYLSPSDSVVTMFNRVGEEYAGTALVLVAIESEDIFEYETLQTINTLSEKFKSIDGVSSVMSLTDILDMKSMDGGLEVGRLINKNKIPTDTEDLKKIKNYTLSKDMYNGRIISSDGKITLLIARLKQSADKQALAEEIQTIAKQEAGSYKLYFSGIPMQMLEINNLVIKDMKKLIPLVILALMLMLYFSFKTKRGVILPLLTVFMSTIWTMGLMTFLDIDLSIVSNGMPVLLIAIGSAFGIHMIAKYKENISSCENKQECIKLTINQIGMPILLAGITTVIGFFSFIGSYLVIVSHFGIFTGIGVAFALIISITFIPISLSYMKYPKIKKNKHGEETNLIVQFLSKLAKFVLKKEKLIVAIGLLVIIASFFLIPRLHREVNMTEYFKEDTDIRIAEEMMEKNFGGSVQIQLVINGNMKDPFVLKEMRKLERFMEAIPKVSKCQSIADLICEMNNVMNNHYTIPDTRQGVSNLWFFIEGENIMEQLVNTNLTEGLIQANLGTVETHEIRKIVKLIDEYIEQQDYSELLVVDNVEFITPEIKEYLISQITSNIIFATNKYDKNIKLNKLKLYEKLIKVINDDNVQYEASTVNNISVNIKEFFFDESEIIIEDERVINNITKSLIYEFKKGVVPDKEWIEPILKQKTLNLSNEDKELLSETAESLKMLLNDYYQHEKTKTYGSKLLLFFPKDLQLNTDFNKDIYDNLWLLNENNFLMPQHLVKDEVLNGSKFNISVSQTGMPLIFTRLDDSLINSQIRSLLIALFLVTILLSFQLKSIIGGLIAVTPIVITVLFNFSLMSFLRIPLDIATIMIASISIGIGIDYTIHFTSRFKTEFAKDKSQLEALEKTMTTTGRAILINALSVTAGFLILLFGEMIPMQRFGWLTAMTMLVSAFSSITFLPALILLSKADFIGDFDRFSMKEKFANLKNRIKYNKTKQK